MPSLASSFERAALPAPASLAELMRWPSRNVSSLLTDGNMVAQFKQWMQRGVLMTAAYSGVGAPEMAARAAQGAAVNASIIAEADMGFVFVEACDSKRIAQVALLSHPHYTTHVFEDLNDRIPKPIALVLDSLEAPDKATPAEKEEAFENMRSFLLCTEAQGDLHRPRRRRMRLRHKMHCIMHDVEMGNTADTCKGDARPLRLHCAGLTCKDYSLRKRSRLGAFGPSGRAMLLWAMERRAQLEDVVIVENVENFDARVLEELLLDNYTFHRFLIGPEDLGWWVSRARLYLVLIKRGVGLNFAGASPDFFAMFGKARPLGGDCARGQMFYAAPAMLVEREKARRWERRFGSLLGGPPAADANAAAVPAEVQSCPWSEALTSFQDARRQISEKQFLDRWSEVHGLQYNPDGDVHVKKTLIQLQSKYKVAFIVDLEQGEEHGQLRYNNMLPCLLSHGEYWSSGAARPLLGEEFFLAQGFPIFGMHDESELPNYDGTVTSWQLSQAQLKDLGGNTMHLDVMNALFLFVLGRLSRSPSQGAPASPSVFSSRDAPEHTSPENAPPRKRQRGSSDMASEEAAP